MREDKSRADERNVFNLIYLNRSTISAPLSWIEYDAMSASWLDEPYITDLFTWPRPWRRDTYRDHVCMLARLYFRASLGSCELVAHKSKLLV